ncbi:MAG: signal recognition particle-docking protein FtsY [Thermoplasmata archaeon]
MFKVLKEKLQTWKKKTAAELDQVITTGRGRRIRASRLEDFLWDLEILLMEADVALPVIEEIKQRVREDLVGKRVSRKVSFAEGIERALKDALREVLLVKDFDFLDFVNNHEKPVIIMFVGVNGTGKTTVIAKLAHLLRKNNLSSVFAASDTFRAGAIEQLEKHSQLLGVKMIKHQSGSDPAAVSYDAIEHAKARNKDVVLIDTAGRMQTNINLMDEMKKIKRVAKPDLIVFVGDALAGNDAVEQAVRFDEAVGIDAAILSKIDADAKGGAALSIVHSIKKPIIFVGTGQGYDDLAPFDAEWMVERIFEV